MDRKTETKGQIYIINHHLHLFKPHYRFLPVAALNPRTKNGRFTNYLSNSNLVPLIRNLIHLDIILALAPPVPKPIAPSPKRSDRPPPPAAPLPSIVPNCLPIAHAHTLTLTLDAQHTHTHTYPVTVTIKSPFHTIPWVSFVSDLLPDQSLFIKYLPSLQHLPLPFHPSTLPFPNTNNVYVRLRHLSLAVSYQSDPSGPLYNRYTILL